MKRANRISDYEIRQVNQFIVNIYTEYGCKMEWEEYVHDAWVAYLVARKQHRACFEDEAYWEHVEKNILKTYNEAKKRQNAQIALISPKSLDAPVGENEEPWINIIHSSHGNFENNVVLWDYARHLGAIKYAVLQLMAREDDEYEIMYKLDLDQKTYHNIREELQEDFRIYQNI